MKICKVCNSRCYSGAYCVRHYGQMRRWGKIFTRTSYDKNEIFYHDGFCEMALYNRKGQVVGHTKLDKEDLVKVKEGKWSKNYEGYVVARKNKKTYILHRLITSCPPDKQIDHINGDTLDNRKKNLRICTNYQNSLNRPKFKNSTSKYKGVHWDKSHKVWVCHVSVNHKLVHIGNFKLERHAAMAYDIWAKDLYGEFAKLNFIKGLQLPG